MLRISVSIHTGLLHTVVPVVFHLYHSVIQQQPYSLFMCSSSLLVALLVSEQFFFLSPLLFHRLVAVFRVVCSAGGLSLCFSVRFPEKRPVSVPVSTGHLSCPASSLVPLVFLRFTLPLFPSSFLIPHVACHFHFNLSKSIHFQIHPPSSSSISPISHSLIGFSSSMQTLFRVAFLLLMSTECDQKSQPRRADSLSPLASKGNSKSSGQISLTHFRNMTFQT